MNKEDANLFERLYPDLVEKWREKIMTEQEFIEAYCMWCDERNYDDASWGKNCYSYERCFSHWGNQTTEKVEKEK